ncbi:nucleoside 2-deoxyribosyltransferase [candidate division WOR-3 bacterium JGI_Cruoil_03_44_89]|uniref:Nucleoside 2-deoxyribosyltransferase n=1 Tax=candidate division WOR-3 bacterium JGI_Cruoil_03_44_89 TaxID=1973748 RepID=A0A235BYZ5_UNCW3|nr:MAG: nucleoside 2-deoxyribosyltransferase [candidate division WOR-3 bacterium JGI_Cruoil_03_44_89]
MCRKPNFDRLCTALYCGEPDYVPLVELGIAQEIKKRFLGKKIYSLKEEVEFWSQAGYDYVKLQPGIDMNLSKITPQKGGWHWASEHKGIISSWQDFEQYIWSKPEDVDYSDFEKITKYLPDSMAVIGQYGDIFTMVWELMGFENFSLMLYEDIELIEALFEKIGTIVFNLFENMVTFDCVKAIWYSDDIAYHAGPIISPIFIRKYLLPWMKKIGDMAKKHNIPYIYHSDGKLWDFIDDIIACGVNAIHPIEPKAMDIVEVKEKVKGKLCVIGNIDLSYTLTRGTPEETEEEVREKIHTVAPGGGYCLGSSNSIPKYVKLKNFIAMVESTKRYGKYPISV